MAATIFLCLMRTPLGTPVLPLVYIITAISSFVGRIFKIFESKSIKAKLLGKDKRKGKCVNLVEIGFLVVVIHLMKSIQFDLCLLMLDSVQIEVEMENK